MISIRRCGGSVDDTPDQRLSVPVVSCLSQPTIGIVSQHAPLGGALRGATVGAIVEMHLPQGVPGEVQNQDRTRTAMLSTMAKTMNQLPDTDSITALAEFWQTHDLTDVEDALVEVTEPVFQHAERLSVILPAEDLAALRTRTRLEHSPETALVSRWIHERLHAG